MHRDDAELAFLMAHDTDSFNRWEAAQARRLKAEGRRQKAEGM